MLSPEKSLPEGLLEKPANAMDELLSQMNKLTLLDEDGWENNEDGDAEVGKLCAIGRLCSNRTMNRSLIKTILGRVWGLLEKDRGVEIKHHSRNSIFLVFSFKSSQDLNRILLKNPWFLTNGTLILDRRGFQCPSLSCVEDMELIVNHDTSSMGKSLGWEEGQINCDTHLIERERVLNVKRNGDWREELKEKTPSIFKSSDTFNPR
uniref:DUF4283 domain-containing protein n=1 Tax=Cannabis sativa TaxID=3483 RepID=A0A803Q0U2_CANSA